MTTDDLALRLAAHPQWRWMAGMRALSPSGAAYRICSVPGTCVLMWVAERVVDRSTGAGPDVPDLTDPATAGCLLAMLAEADPTQRWVYGDGHALAEALLACWGESLLT